MFLVRSIALALALTCSLLCAVAVAQESGADTESEARQFLKEGIVLHNEGKLQEAFEAFDKSFRLRESYDTAGNLGQVEMKLGYYALAARHFEYCLRNFPTGENRQLKQAVEGLYAEVKPKVVMVQASIGPPGVQVMLNDVRVGRAPISHPLFTKPDVRYLLKIEASDGRSESMEIIGKAGQTLEVALSLNEANGNVPKIDSGLGNEADAEVPPRGQTSTYRKRPSLVPAFILGGATVAALGTSIVFRSLSASNTNKMDEISADIPDDGCVASSSAPSACGELQDVGDRANVQATIADVTLIAGGVLGAATIGYVVYALVRPSRAKGVQATVLPQPGGGIFSLSGHF